LVADFTGHSSLAVLFGPGTGRLRERTSIPAIKKKGSGGSRWLCTCV
jgi:hypothetical protein